MNKEEETLPKKVNYLLEKGKLIDNEWKDDKLKTMINDCINIEKNIDNINKINKDLKEYNSKKINFKFIPEEDEKINEFINSIKSFGKLTNIDDNLNDSDILNTSDKKQKLKIFHELCDNIKNNLIIVENENNEIFGGFSNSWYWDTSGNDLTINDGFLFNLTKDKKNNNQNIRILKGCKDHGPYIYNKLYFDKSMKKCYIENKDYSDNLGMNNIKQVEIYQITILNN